MNAAATYPYKTLCACDKSESLASEAEQLGEIAARQVKFVLTSTNLNRRNEHATPASANGGRVSNSLSIVRS